MADVDYLVSSLSRHKLKPTAIVLNRAETEPPEAEKVLLTALDDGSLDAGSVPYQALRQLLLTMRHEHDSRARAANIACDRLQAITPAGTQVVRLPFVHRNDPTAIVLALADAWSEWGLA